jgi:hypothetical protein
LAAVFLTPEVFMDQILELLATFEAQKETVIAYAKFIGVLIFGLLLVAWGVFMLRNPEDVWYLSHWHSVSGGEPSQYYLDRCYVGGVISVLIGAVLVIGGVFKLISLL